MWQAMAKNVTTTFVVANMVTVGQVMTFVHLPKIVKAIVNQVAAPVVLVVVRVPLM